MEKQIYIITYSSANYCGAPSHCLVLAEDEDDAVCIADPHMYETQREADIDQMEEEGLDTDDIMYTVDKVELLEFSEHEEFAVKESQREFFPKVNF